MPLLVGCLALGFPRLALFSVWFFGGSYLSRSTEHWGFLLLGFFFLPLTTLAFAYATNSLGAPGDVTPLGWILIVLATATDIGLIGPGLRARRKHERDE